jgi:hypothetical protein
MRRHALGWAVGWALAAAALTPPPASAWGALGYERVAGAVPSMLPTDAEPLLVLGPFLVRYSMDAAAGGEGGDEPDRLYFHLDAYPWPDRWFVPSRRAAWEARYGVATVLERGVLPWAIDGRYRDLVAALRERDVERAGRVWSDLTHYLADACEPIRTTSRADPHVLDRLGSELLVRYRPHLELPALTRRVVPVRDPFREAVKVIGSSARLAPGVIEVERRARREGVGSSAYYARLWHELGPMTAQRLGFAAEEAARFGYSAWLEAGRPDLTRPTTGAAR